jgi:hypothetical protein
MKLINYLKPKNVNLTKKRLGPHRDGGYVIPEIILEKCSSLFNYGVENEMGYEVEFAETYNKPVFMFDHTINPIDASKINKNLHFKHEGLGFTERCSDFINHSNEFNFLENVLLKIDIESNEYSYFETVDIDEISKRCIGIILEAHYLSDIRWRERFFNIMDKINKHYILCHVHGNNYGSVFNYEGKSVMDVVELSFIRKDMVKYSDDIVGDYPITNLDYPNNPSKPDISLDFLKF